MNTTHVPRQTIIFRLFVLLLLAIPLVMGCDLLNSDEEQAQAEPMFSPDQHKDVIRRFTDAQNNRDFDALDALVVQAFVRHSRATPGLIVRSLEDFKAFLRQDLATVPDSRVEIEMMVAEDDKVAVYASYSGTQEGAFGPFPPSGKKMAIKFMGIFRFEQGKIAELWVEWDNLDALMQLGHFPPSGGGEE